MFRKTVLNPVVSVFFLAAIALCASGCGKSLPKLTDAQKAELGDTLQAASRGAVATRNVAGARNQVNASDVAALPANAQWALSLTGSSPARDEKEAQLETKLQAAFQNKTCDVSADVPQAPVGGSGLGATNLQMSLKASGNNCPIAMNFAISVQGSQSGATGQISCQYSVKDEDLAKIVDVTALSMDGSFNVSMSSDSGKISLDLKGGLTSLQYGNVTFTAKADGSGSQSGSEVEVTTDFVFPTFEAELKVKQDGQKRTYEINGEEVTEAEFMSYFDKAGLGTMTGGSMGGSMGGMPGTTPTFPTNPTMPSFPGSSI